jgi:UDP:flavonoid glycosyltransferase YjiC (YdhE family)
MKILLASALGAGHINPILAVGRILLAEGHEIAMLSGRAYRERIEAAGVVFYPLPPEVDFNSLLDAVPELKDLPPGPQFMRIAMERFLIDPIPGQHKGLQQALRAFPADLIVADEMIFGLLPMLLGPRPKRPAIIMCGTSILHAPRDDGAPGFVGLPPATTQAQRDEYAAIGAEYARLIHHPVSLHLNQCLAQLGVGPLPMRLFESGVELADAYMQLSVPGFEYPREKPHRAKFIGAMPIVPKQAPIPAWGHELDGSRKVVLVTQGTVANHDFGRLVTPALTALENETDLLVVVTIGGRPTDAIPGPIPANARISSYLPFEWLLPKVDVLVTNGGYGSVNQALSFGIPLVSAGLTEDKAAVNARIAWSGVGINLAINEPTPDALREAVRAVLDKPDYRLRAALMAAEFDAIDTRAEILRIVRQVTQEHPIQTMAAE